MWSGVTALELCAKETDLEHWTVSLPYKPVFVGLISKRCGVADPKDTLR